MTKRTLSEAMNDYIQSCISPLDYLNRTHDDLEDMPRLAGSIHLHKMYTRRTIDEEKLKEDPIWNSKLVLRLIRNGVVHPGRKDINYIITRGQQLDLFTKQEVDEAISDYDCRFILS